MDEIKDQIQDLKEKIKNSDFAKKIREGIKNRNKKRVVAVVINDEMIYLFGHVKARRAFVQIKDAYVCDFEIESQTITLLHDAGHCYLPYDQVECIFEGTIEESI